MAPPRKKRTRASNAAASIGDAGSEAGSAADSPLLGTKAPALAPVDEAGPYARLQSSLDAGLLDLLAALAKRRSAETGTMRPIDQAEMDGLVTTLFESLPDVVGPVSEGEPSPAQKSRLDLRRQIISAELHALVTSVAYPPPHSPLAEAPPAVQHQLLHDALDVSLSFVEKGWASVETTLIALEEVLDTATVAEAERAFTYLETRVKRLTKGMVPERGNSLTFLRMQNSLLRRLSKSIHTVFCGRILAFLASVFPIAERSGVNLRGGFNVGNVTTFDADPVREASAEVEQKAVEPEEKMQVDEPVKSPKEDGEEDSVDGDEPGEEEVQRKEEEEKTDAKRAAEAKAAAQAAKEKQEFYHTFWSLQALLSNPPELFKGWRGPPAGPVAALLPGSKTSSGPSSSSSGPHGRNASTADDADPSTPYLAALRDGIAKTLKVFSATTEKELEMGGKQAAAGEKGKERSRAMDVDDADEEQVKEHYFFAKYLTKRNLLDLEVSDPYFRRQVLTQFLIVLGYIRSFSQDERNVRAALPKPNRTLDGPYVCEARDEAWVKDLLGKVWKAIDATPPNGNVFSRTMMQIIKRDNNWVLWKANSCQSFTKDPLQPSEVDKAKQGFKTVARYPPQNRFRVGTDALTKLWDVKVTAENMETIDPKKGVMSLEEYLQMIQKADEEIEARKMDLELERKDAAAIAKDPEIIEIEERKTSLSWRALRIAQASHLQHFKDIGLGDFEKLMTAIAEAKQARLAKKKAQSENEEISVDKGKESDGEDKAKEGEEMVKIDPAAGEQKEGGEADEEVEADKDVEAGKDVEAEQVSLKVEPMDVDAEAGTGAEVGAVDAEVEVPVDEEVEDIEVKEVEVAKPIEDKPSGTPKRARSDDDVSEASSAKKVKI